MRTATFTDLCRGFRTLSAWIENGETIQILKRGKPFARLEPRRNPNPTPFDSMAHMKRRKRTWGDRVFSAAEVTAMREAELEGEDG
jgi:antitoxin (DNA-binding transcriptional repressor) of toxin-antitoxin stability system